MSIPEVLQKFGSEVANFAAFQKERGVEVADHSLSRLKTLVTSVIERGVPASEEGRIWLIVLLSSLRSILHQKKMGEDRSTTYNAVGKFLAKTLRDGWKIESGSIKGNAENPKIVGKHLFDTNRKVWWSIINAMQAPFVCGEEGIHPCAVYNIGGWDLLVQTAWVFRKAREATLLVFDVSDLAKDVREGASGKNALEAYLRALAFAKKKGDFTTFGEIHDADKELREFAEARGWETPEFTVETSSKPAPVKVSSKGATPKKSRKRKASELPELDAIITQALSVCEFEGDEGDAIREAVMGEFRDTAELMRNEESARKWYAKKYGEPFAEALFSTVETTPVETAPASEAETSKDATSEEAKPVETTPVETAPKAKPKSDRRDATSRTKKTEVVASSRKEGDNGAGDDMASALAAAGITAKSTRLVSKEETARGMLEGVIPSNLIELVAQSIARGVVEAGVDPLNQTSIEDWLSGTGAVPKIGPARRTKVATAIATAGS